MSAVEIHEIQEDEAGMRLDRWFKVRFPEVGHGQLQKMLRKGQVRLDGKRIKANERVESGQLVRVPPLNAGSVGTNVQKRTSKHEISDVDRALLESCILHRDKSVIVLNKPHGLAVQGGSRTTRHLDGMLDALGAEGGERPKLVHRLDKDTSGVLILAATAKAARVLTAAFRTKDVRKLYWALVSGVPKPLSGRIDLALAKSSVGSRSSGREQMTPDPEDGKKAVTHYEVQEKAGRALPGWRWSH